MRKRNKILSIFMMSMLCVVMLCGSVFASDTKSHAASALTFKTMVATAQTKKTVSVLFIGTSMTYYNNLPKMFEGVAAAANPSTNYAAYSMTYASRELAEHANAIKTVIKVKGNASKLTKKQQNYFRYTQTKGDAGTYKKGVFNEYKKAIYSSGRLRTFDYIVIQHNATGYNANTVKSAVSRISKLIGNKNTTILINAPNQRIRKEKGIESQKDAYVKNILKPDEKIAKDLNGGILKGKYFKEVKVANTGLAFYNWLLTYGTDYALNKVPAAFKSYRNKVDTDVTLKKGLCHPTQLGTYMIAATLYSTMTGKSATTGASTFKANVKEGGLNIRGLSPGTNYSTKAFGNTSILKKACALAYKTAKGLLR